LMTWFSLLGSLHLDPSFKIRKNTKHKNMLF
jgi:hypothetical protein